MTKDQNNPGTHCSDWIERYIQAVLKTIPVRQRAEAEAKLRADIQEAIRQKMLEKNPQQSDIPGNAEPDVPSGIHAAAEPDENTIREILESMGNPARLAEKYRKYPRSLIGSPLFETYWLVVRIVLLAIAIGMVIAMSIQMVTNPPATIGDGIAYWISNLIQSLIGAFGMITIVFALIDHFSPELYQTAAQKTDKSWNIRTLPPSPVDKLHIKPGDPIATIIFSLVFLIILLFFTELFGYYQQTTDGIRIIPLFGAGLRPHLIWIGTAIGLGVVLEIVKLARSRWSFFLMIACLAQNVFSLVVTLRALRAPNLINDDFREAIVRLFAQGSVQLPAQWLEYFLTSVAVLTVLGFVVDSANLLVKGKHLAMQKWS